MLRSATRFRSVRTRSFPGVLAAVLLLGALGAPAWAQPGAAPAAPAPGLSAIAPGEISVSGTGKVSRRPDYVEVTVGVIRMHTDAATAQTQAAEAMTKVVAALEALKIEGLELRTSAVELEPRLSDYRNDRVPEIVAYSATMMVYVKSKTPTDGPRLLTAAIAQGANQIGSLNYGITAALQAREEALLLAVRAARRKAETMAGALGVRLGGLKSASETVQSYWPMSRMSQMTQNVASATSAEVGEGSMMPGTVDVVVTANLTYNVAP